MIINVNTKKTYDVYVDYGILDKAGEITKEYISPCNALIVTDDTVDKLYSDRIIESLSKSGFNVYKFVFPHGEESKNIEVFYDILNYMAEKQMTRSDIAFALGGGVCGDLTGFAAASYLRGIKFVQVPTTLLAAVDSSVGGKTGINLKNGKNLAGAFHQPSLVICDCDTFKTLPDDIFSCGVCEAIKSGIIGDAELFEKFENGSYREDIVNVVSSCVKFKADIVSRDEFESGERKLLNLGHTVGHAVEKLSNYSIPHGHAVSIGTAIITRAAFIAGFCEKSLCDRIINVLNRCSLPTESPYSVSELTKIMLNDKKRSGTFVSFVIPEKIGKCNLHNVDINNIEAFINKAL